METRSLSPDVRTRILETAWRLISERNDASVTLVDIAREAGVSRQTLYVNFGSRAGLFTAMVDHRDETSAGLAAMKRTPAELSPDQALETYVRAWFGYVPEIFPVARALVAARGSDEDARTTWDSRMELLRGGLLRLMKALRSEGRLQPGWTTESATDWCLHLIHVDTWQHLVVERGWKPADLVQKVLLSLRRSVLVDPPAGK